MNMSGHENPVYTIMSLLSFLYYLLESFSFFFVSLAKGLPIVFIFKKTQKHFVPLIFFHCFPILFFCFALINSNLYYFLPSDVNFGLSWVPLHPVPWTKSVYVKSFFPLNNGAYHYKFPHNTAFAPYKYCYVEFLFLFVSR